jgi:pyruvate formate lyase activating enzyme
LNDSAAGIVFDIRKFSVHDGPGIRTTVFFKGCPLRCGWCHNPESQAPKREQVYWEDRCLKCRACIGACPQNAIRWDGNRPITDPEKCTLTGACVKSCYADARQIAGREMTVAQVMSEIKSDIPFYDQSGGGVTFSGGEPLMQSEFLVALLLACREWEIHTAVDTCGFASWKVLSRLRPYVGLFLYDLKLMQPATHKQLTGVSNARILENLRRLSECGHNIVLRIPIIPGVNDDEANIRAIGAFAASLPRLDRVDILPYHRAAISKYARLHRAYGFPELQPPPEAHLAEIQQLLGQYGLYVKVGG